MTIKYATAAIAGKQQRKMDEIPLKKSLPNGNFGKDFFIFSCFQQTSVLKILDMMEETSTAISSDVSFRPSSSHLFMIPAQPFTIKALYISILMGLQDISVFFHKLQR